MSKNNKRTKETPVPEIYIFHLGQTRNNELKKMIFKENTSVRYNSVTYNITLNFC